MIKKIKWNNYNALGNLELDFSRTDGSVYNTIVLAGENGCGKTTILDTLASFLNRQSCASFQYIDYIVNQTVYRIIPHNEFAEGGYHTRQDLSTQERTVVNTGQGTNPHKIDEDILDLRHYGFAYSKARSGFKTGKVKTTSTLQLDNEKYEPDADEDYTNIKQLLVDINEQDVIDWMNISKAGGLDDHKLIDFQKKSKGYRFEKAFNDFFSNIKYKGIKSDDPNEKIVLFEKHNQEISIDQLSTGEKQIVFRGANLLRNTNSIQNGVVLIDEPELSMHPIWQKKILDYYRNLFTSNGKQSVQMIFATHSEYVIQSALSDRNNVLVIVLTDDNGIISSRNIDAPNALPQITVAETNYLAFNLLSVDYHIELYGWLQSKTQNHSIDACDAFIMNQPQYNPSIHYKPDNSYHGHNWQTLPTYIRNAIDHPDSGRSFTDIELRNSIELLIELCK